MLFLVSLLLASLTPTATVEQQPARADCSAAEFHQFDFWIGSWAVTEKGKPAGTNRIEAVLGGCALVEHWSSASGGSGMSLNFYDRATKSWYQSWTDQQGGALRLKGGFERDRMVLASESGGGSGDAVHHRITWTQQPDRSVRQLWESSKDGGKTWTVAFDGLYVKQS